MIPWKLASASGDVSAMVLVMLVVAAIFNTVLLPVLPSTASPERRRGPGLLFVLSLVIAVLTLLGNTATAASITRLSAPMVSVILRSDVVMTALLGWLFLSERLRARFFVGAGVAVWGLWIAQSPAHTSAGDPIGVGQSVVAAAAFSGIGVLTRRFVRDVNVVALNALRLWLSVLLWFAVHGLQLPAGLDRDVLVYAGLAAIIGPGIARLCLMLSARDLEARWTAMFGLTGPVWALVFSALFLGDLPSSNELIGGAIMLIGIGAALQGRRLRS